MCFIGWIDVLSLLSFKFNEFMEFNEFNWSRARKQALRRGKLIKLINS